MDGYGEVIETQYVPGTKRQHGQRVCITFEGPTALDDACDYVSSMCRLSERATADTEYQRYNDCDQTFTARGWNGE